MDTMYLHNDTAKKRYYPIRPVVLNVRVRRLKFGVEGRFVVSHNRKMYYLAIFRTRKVREIFSQFLHVGHGYLNFRR